MRENIYKVLLGIVVLMLLIGTVHFRRVDEASYGGKTKLVIWGAPLSEGGRAIREAFERKHPGIKVVFGAQSRGMDEQKLMCSIAGGAPPDLVHQDRFALGGWAARDAFIPLDDLIARDIDQPSCPRADDFFSACWAEAVYDGRVYGIPWSTDVRGLFYNEDLLIREGFVDDAGNGVPPKTWEEMVRYCDELAKFDEDGNILQLGFMPLFLEATQGGRIGMFGNSWLYLYGWANGGRFMSDPRTVTLNDPLIVEALQWIVDFYDRYGGVERIQAFQSDFQGGALSPFIQGKVAMVVDGNVGPPNEVAHFKPGMRFGMTLPPAPAGKQRVTWSGGFSWVIPVGSQHVDEAWEYIKFSTSYAGYDAYECAEQSLRKASGVLYMPGIAANRVAAERITAKYAPDEPRFRRIAEEALAMMEVSKFRPVTPVGQVLWDEHVRATERAVFHELQPADALSRGNAVVQERLDEILGATSYPVVAWQWPVGGSLSLFAVAAVAVRRRARRYFALYPSTLAKRENLAGYLFVSPWLIGTLVFGVGPILFSVLLGFCKYDVLHAPRFVGWGNYASLVGLSIQRAAEGAAGARLIAADRIFYKSLFNTVFMMMAIPLGMVVGLAIAMILAAEKRGIAAFRTLFYLPAIVPFVATSILWMQLLNPQQGLVNLLLDMLLGVQGPAWLNDADWAKWAMILMGLWGAGGGMIIWLAGLKSIPHQLYEAADIDGASWWQKTLRITLPMLSPYIFFNMIMGVIGTLQIFAQSYIMTNGGPADSTLFYVFYLFNNAFRYFQMGRASAMAWILFLIVLALTVFQLRMAPHWVHYEAEGKR